MASMAPLCPCVLTRSRCHFVPRLAPRGFPGRQEWRVESGGDERGAKKEGGGLFSGRHPLSWRRAPVGRGMQKGTGTGHGRRCALASARMTGRGILPHVDRAPGSARGGGRGAHTEARGERTGCQGKKKPVCAGERTDDGAGHPPPTSIGPRFSGGAVGCGAHTEARGERTGWQGKKKRRCALASARGGGAGILPPRRSGSRFSAGRRGEERARCGPTRLNAIRPALFVRGDSLWIPAATYLPGPSPAKYCRRMRA